MYYIYIYIDMQFQREEDRERERQIECVVLTYMSKVCFVLVSIMSYLAYSNYKRLGYEYRSLLQDSPLAQLPNAYLQNQLYHMKSTYYIYDMHIYIYICDVYKRLRMNIYIYIYIIYIYIYICIYAYVFTVYTCIICTHYLVQ